VRVRLGNEGREGGRGRVGYLRRRVNSAPGCSCVYVCVCVCVRACVRASDTKERGCGRIEDRAGRGMKEGGGGRPESLEPRGRDNTF